MAVLPILFEIYMPKKRVIERNINEVNVNILPFIKSNFFVFKISPKQIY